jgi:hypothetical protein
MANCKICDSETSTAFCEYCGIRVEQFIATNQNHSTMNIQWGAGKITWKDAGLLMTLVRQESIDEILEFGTGLSTEIFSLTGAKIVSCDVHGKHSELFSQLEPLSGWQYISKMFRLVYPKVDFIHYEPGVLPDFEKLYPGKKWKLVFVDGPHQRDSETEAAIKLSSKFIYLHDAGMSRFDHTLPGFSLVDDRLWMINE